MAKNYTLPIDVVLYDMSITNIHMYNAVLPTYSDKSKKKGKGEVIKADDPKNRDKMIEAIKHFNSL